MRGTPFSSNYCIIVWHEVLMLRHPAGPRVVRFYPKKLQHLRHWHLLFTVNLQLETGYCSAVGVAVYEKGVSGLFDLFDLCP